jgi:D-galactose 1-dehydrogenase
MAVPLAIVGGGKVARERHVPAIAASGDFVFAAAVTLPSAPLPGVPNFRSIGRFKAEMPEVQAVALCTPPQGRHRLAMEALAAGLDILNEKPPASTVSEAEEMADCARKAGRVFYQSWHSREAAAVAPAAAWLKGKKVRRVDVTWKEDARIFHPDQEWIWQPGIGVFDPGINAISLLTAILAGPLTLTAAELRVPAGKAAPVAASLTFRDGAGAVIAAEFDFDQRGQPAWEIAVATEDGVLELSRGGAVMAIDGVPVKVGGEPEYARVYRRFAGLLRAGASEADFAPLRLVADAFRLGRRVTVSPFS